MKYFNHVFLVLFAAAILLSSSAEATFPSFAPYTGPRKNDEFKLNDASMKAKLVDFEGKSIGSVYCNLGQNINLNGAMTGFSVTYIGETEKFVTVRYNGPFKSKNSTVLDSDRCSNKFYIVKKDEFYWNWNLKGKKNSGSQNDAATLAQRDPEMAAAIRMIQSFNTPPALLFRAEDLCIDNPSYNNCNIEKNPAAKSEKIPPSALKKIWQNVKEYFSSPGSTRAE